MSIISPVAGDFLTHWQNDAPRRWSATDFAAQQAFVNGQVEGREWTDWSTPMAAMQLIQASLLKAPLEDGDRHDAIVLAGPVTELVPPKELFSLAAGRLRPGGRLIGVFPCLRDNSPESARFMELTKAGLWPYFVEEEVREVLGEAGYDTCGSQAVAGFHAIPQFNRAVLGDDLGFKGFQRIFVEMEGEGYDAMEVGFGELRFAVSLGA